MQEVLIRLMQEQTQELITAMVTFIMQQQEKIQELQKYYTQDTQDIQ